MIIVAVRIGMTTAVTRTKVADMSATAMIEAGVRIGPMATGNESIHRRRSSFHRLDRRASTFFFHPSFFALEWIAAR
jgi:hypothetical protein